MTQDRFGDRPVQITAGDLVQPVDFYNVRSVVAGEAVVPDSRRNQGTDGCSIAVDVIVRLACTQMWRLQS